MHRAPNGYLATIQTTNLSNLSPNDAADLWAEVSRQRYPPRWDGVEPGGALVVYWTPTPTRLTCGHCRASLGTYRAYQAAGEYGLIRNTARRYHPKTRYPPDVLVQMPNDRVQPARPTSWMTGEVGFKAARTVAHFRCTKCGHIYERNLRRLGIDLWKRHPRTHALLP